MGIFCFFRLYVFFFKCGNGFILFRNVILEVYVFCFDDIFNIIKVLEEYIEENDNFGIKVLVEWIEMI